MRQPGPTLEAVDAEALQPLLNVPGEQRRVASVFLEDEHADTARLAVANRRESDLTRAARGVPQCADDRLELACGAVTEERQRDVQVLSRHDADADQPLTLPPRDPVEDGVGQAQREEEPDLFIAAHASARSHAAWSRLPVRSARSRWRAVTVARTRTCPRSPGRSSMRASDPSGPAACKWTRPTGFSGVAPPGPATPVTATATSAPSRSRAPAAIAAATSAETAPCWAISSSGTPSSELFTSSAYATMPPTKLALEPVTSVRRAATMPPVQDSAVASRRPFAPASESTSSATPRSSRAKSHLSRRSVSAASRTFARSSAPRSTTKSTWISNSRAQMVAST